jgi:hypothetical protein
MQTGCFVPLAAVVYSSDDIANLLISKAIGVAALSLKVDHSKAGLSHRVWQLISVNAVGDV